MNQLLAGCAALVLCAVPVLSQEKYRGPRPPKPDVPYLVHASHLIPTEVVEARQEDKKDDSIFVVPGAASSVKTPLAEPVFLMEADKFNPERVDLWRMDTRGGQREIVLSKKAKRNGPRPIRVLVSHIDGRLYRIEVAQTLEPGEYSLSPSDSNQAFCFSVY
jgi:hypothetical protein